MVATPLTGSALQQYREGLRLPLLQAVYLHQKEHPEGISIDELLARLELPAASITAREVAFTLGDGDRVQLTEERLLALTLIGLEEIAQHSQGRIAQDAMRDLEQAREAAAEMLLDAFARMVDAQASPELWSYLLDLGMSEAQAQAVFRDLPAGVRDSEGIRALRSAVLDTLTHHAEEYVIGAMRETGPYVQGVINERIFEEAALGSLTK